MAPKHQSRSTWTWSSIALVMSCILSGGHSQNLTTNFGDNTNTSSANVLDILNTLDVQKIIGEMLKDGSLAEVASVIATSGVDISGQCVKDLLTAIQGVGNMDVWAIQMIDAIGKPHSGIISDLDFNWLGSFDECVGIRAITYSNDTLLSDPVHHFDGRYCKVGIPIPASLLASFANTPNADPGAVLGTQTSLRIGVCTSNACSTQDMKHIMALVGRYVFNASSTYQPQAECHEGLDIDTTGIIAICILSILGVIVIIGTLLDIGKRMKKREPILVDVKCDLDNQTNGEAKGNLDTVDGGLDVKGKASVDLAVEDPKRTMAPVRAVEQYNTLEKIFLSFSVYTNGLKLLSTHQPKGALSCINGIRFLSMTWVILGHSVPFNVKNGLSYWFMRKVWQWTFYGIFSATVSVDTFFTMSGLLVAYLTLKELSKRGSAKKMNWLMFYFHRYWRLTPAYMLVLMLDATIVPYIGTGPKWPQVLTDKDNCAKAWWTNLLYVNNYVYDTEGCMGWSWYLANDMQFYVISPLIIVPLFYNVYVGGIVSFLFLAGTTVARAVISKQHEYTALIGGFIGPRPKDTHFGDNLYIASYTRMGPYIIGILAGYLLYRYKDTFKMKRSLNLLGWLGCFSIIVLVIYGVYPDDGNHFLSVNESVVYLTLHRTGWGIAIAWIIFACATGHGGWINDFLSWKAFIPLARLTYCAYLIHPISLAYYQISQRMDVYMTDFEHIYVYLGNTVVAYMLAFVTSLLFESPMMGLEKVAFKRK